MCMIIHLLCMYRGESSGARRSRGARAGRPRAWRGRPGARLDPGDSPGSGTQQRERERERGREREGERERDKEREPLIYQGAEAEAPSSSRARRHAFEATLYLLSGSACINIMGVDNTV